ncbi:MAG: hypothetical protein O3C34_21310 [Proteobacteria bacterium]|nr:hypothetical protein [Pseudomonadota bacterium]
MAETLTNDQVKQFEEDGFLFPYDVYTPEEAAALYAKYAKLEETLGEEPQKRFRIKAQLPFPWLCDVVRHPRLLDAVEDLIGPDILCWGAAFFTKKSQRSAIYLLAHGQFHLRVRAGGNGDGVAWIQ